MSRKTDLETVARVVELAGVTYAQEAGLPLRDTPAPLYQLLVLSTLIAKPIYPEIAVAACRELRRAGMRTPAAMRAASWQDRADALGRARYKSYGESTATDLEEAATVLIERYGGDLRRLASASRRRVPAAYGLLQEIPGVGPVAANVFLREVQQVWGWVRPFFDMRVIDGAKALGIGHSASALRGLAATVPGTPGADPVPRLASALVRVSVDGRLLDRVGTPAGAGRR
jgi:endonuclease III